MIKVPIRSGRRRLGSPAEGTATSNRESARRLQYRWRLSTYLFEDQPGYAPGCASEFGRGACELPKVQCGECLKRAFLPAGGGRSSITSAA
jgi:hypothetical protein